MRQRHHQSRLTRSSGDRAGVVGADHQLVSWFAAVVCLLGALRQAGTGLKRRLAVSQRRCRRPRRRLCHEPALVVSAHTGVRSAEIACGDHAVSTPQRPHQASTSEFVNLRSSRVDTSRGDERDQPDNHHTRRHRQARDLATTQPIRASIRDPLIETGCAPPSVRLLRPSWPICPTTDGSRVVDGGSR